MPSGNSAVRPAAEVGLEVLLIVSTSSGLKAPGILHDPMRPIRFSPLQ